MDNQMIPLDDLRNQFAHLFDNYGQLVDGIQMAAEDGDTESVVEYSQHLQNSYHQIADMLGTMATMVQELANQRDDAIRDAEFQKARTEERWQAGYSQGAAEGVAYAHSETYQDELHWDRIWDMAQEVIPGDWGAIADIFTHGEFKPDSLEQLKEFVQELEDRAND